MSVVSSCASRSASRLCRNRRLRAEALESRAMLSAAGIAPLPFSVVMTNQPSSVGLPPATCIQFNPLTTLSAATSNLSAQWQGHFTEKLQEAPVSATSATAPAAWLVDVVYNLNGQQILPPSVPIGPAASSKFFNISGTARETITPLNAAGVPVGTAQQWIGNDSLVSHFVVSPSTQMNPVANSFTFTTDTTIKQILAPVALTAGTLTTVKSWIVSTTTHTTGNVVAPTLASGTISLQEQIKQTLSPVSSTSSVPAWTIDAEFDASGTFQLKPSPTAIIPTATGSLTLKGELTGTISPPPGTTILTQKIDTLVAADVVFEPILVMPPIAPNPTSVPTSPPSVV